MQSNDAAAITQRVDFDAFVRTAEPRLRRALYAMRGSQAGEDAVAEALAYAWANWPMLQTMENPVGYLYRVGQSRSRPLRRPRLPGVDDQRLPEVEPGLPRALAARQRGAVWLVHGCGWTYRETAEALGISVSTVGTHVQRALVRLRNVLEVRND